MRPNRWNAFDPMPGFPSRSDSRSEPTIYWTRRSTDSGKAFSEKPERRSGIVVRRDMPCVPASVPGRKSDVRRPEDGSSGLGVDPERLRAMDPSVDPKVGKNPMRFGKNREKTLDKR